MLRLYEICNLYKSGERHGTRTFESEIFGSAILGVIEEGARDSIDN